MSTYHQHDRHHPLRHRPHLGHLCMGRSFTMKRKTQFVNHDVINVMSKHKRKLFTAYQKA